MKSVGMLVSLGLIVAGAAVAVLGRVDVGTLLGVLGFVGLAAQSIVGNRRSIETGARDDLTNEDHARLSPLRKLRKEIHAIVEAKRSDPTVAVVGSEAVQEADRIYDQCAQLLKVRRELNRAFGGRAAAERELQTLERDLASAATEVERSALASALEARKLEAAHYAHADNALERIEAGLRQAQAALSEMKARLATVSAGQLGSSNDLEETLGRLRTLGTSLDEAEAWLRSQ